MASASTVKAVGTGLKSGFAEGPNKFKLQISGHDVTQIQIAFEGPSQPKTTLTTLKDKSGVDVTFTTPVPGDYKIHVVYGGTNIPGSPFKTKLLGDPKLIKDAVDSVKVSGTGLTKGLLNQNNEIVIDGRESGICGGLSANMEGTSKPEISFRNEEDDTVTLVYKPTAAGNYKLHLKYGLYALKGSPFKLEVS